MLRLARQPTLEPSSPHTAEARPALHNLMPQETLTSPRIGRQTLADALPLPLQLNRNTSLEWTRLPMILLLREEPEKWLKNPQKLPSAGWKTLVKAVIRWKLKVCAQIYITLKVRFDLKR